MSLSIHPETRVGALLEAYPGIEEALIGWVPTFAKLRNPVLRKTVAKVATLEQAARVAGVSVRDLVQKLRQETGQENGAPAGDSGECLRPDMAPAWTGTAKVRETIEADAMLEAGIHPLGRVRRAAEELPASEAVLLISSFRPAPLIDTLVQAGFAVHSNETRPGRHETLIGRLA